MTQYQLSHENWVTRLPDTRFVVGDLGNQNPEYLAYRAWLAEGNVPLPPDEPSRVAIRSRLHESRRTARTQAETGGFVFNGHPVDSDRDSILRIGNAATTALTASLSQAPFSTAWTCADEYQMYLDVMGVLDLQAALSAHGLACHLRSQELKALIDAPDANLDALADVISTGWPGPAQP